VQLGIAINDRDLPADSGAALARRVDGASAVHSLWTNETGAADATVTLGAWAAVTDRVVLATGVVPLAARSLAQLGNAAAQLGRMTGGGRLLLGIGVGQRSAAETIHQRPWRPPLEWTSEAVAELRRREPAPRVILAALGPKMLTLAAREADGALLNWTTADHARTQRSQLLEVSGRRPGDVLLCGYVRVAAGPDADAALAEQIGYYRALPFYREHWEAMGSPPQNALTVASRDGRDLRDRLAEYDALDVVVARIVPTPDFGVDRMVDLLCS
jgi:alkanesulfonate monooxygenase SsuD/methylene tetrahydromethanopterin reductase-like flavin-dependent oxidoreductase (luciferase family)